jgi:RNA polymerase sigma-70 factor (ECF subfamily)
MSAVESVADRAAWDSIADEEVVERIRAGNTALYEVLMRRYNQRLFRIAYSILRNYSEAEDVMQEAYVRAYQHLEQFAGEAKFSTWLTKIAINEALQRVRRSWRTESFESSLETHLNPMDNVRTNMRDPERQTYDEELRLVLEGAIEARPEAYRSVFVLRAVEGLSAAETAACLDIGEEAVKSRLHRARKMLQKDLRQRASLMTAEAFPFHLSRCDRVVNAVLKRIAPSV